MGKSCDVRGRKALEHGEKCHVIQSSRLLDMRYVSKDGPMARHGCAQL